MPSPAQVGDPNATGTIDPLKYDISPNMPAAIMLSPEAMIAFVATQLGEVDGAIGEKIGSLNAIKERATLFSKISAEMGSCANTSFEKQLEKYNELKELAKGDPEALAMLDKWATAAKTKTGNMGDTDNTWLQGQIAPFNAKANELSGQTDLSMIELQSMVEKRSRTIAFASKVVASLNDSVKEVINNIR